MIISSEAYMSYDRHMGLKRRVLPAAFRKKKEFTENSGDQVRILPYVTPYVEARVNNFLPIIEKYAFRRQIHIFIIFGFTGNKQ